MFISSFEPRFLQLNQQQTLGSALRPGQQFSTIVQGSGDRLFLQLGTQRVPLGAELGLAPGSAVLVETVQAEQGLRLQITPRTAPDTLGASQRPAPSLESALTRILAQLGIASDENVASIVPARMPVDVEALRQLFALFSSRGSLSTDLQSIATTLQQAAAAGVLTPTVAAAFQSLLAAFAAAEAPEWDALLRRLGDTRPMAARLAAVVDGVKLDVALAGMHEQLRAEVARLRGNDALLTYLRGNRQLKQFEQTLHRVLERFSAGDSQNLRALDQPYLFLELPVTNAQLLHLQVHIIGEEQKRRGGEKPRGGLVVLDVALTRLGALWISLQTARDRCVCHIRAANDAARVELGAGRTELEAALREAGFVHAEVSISAWSGDRLHEAASLLRQFSGIQRNV